MKKAIIAVAIVAAMSVPTLGQAAAHKSKKVVCQPVACAPACAPCFNPLAIVGGVVQGIGCAVSSVGAGVAGLFGCAPACP
jgi:hypothetical protein